MDVVLGAFLFFAWCILAGISDNFLKPILLSRGGDVPVWVILIGTLGGLIAHGLIGLLRIKGLSVAYLAGLRAWRGDDSPDKARTMAALDKALRRLDGWAAMIDRFHRPAASPQAA